MVDWDDTVEIRCGRMGFDILRLLQVAAGMPNKECAIFDWETTTTTTTTTTTIFDWETRKLRRLCALRQLGGCVVSDSK